MNPGTPGSAGERPNLWRRFRSLKTRTQRITGAVVVLVVLAVIGGVVGEDTSGNNATVSSEGPTNATAATTIEPPTTSTSTTVPETTTSTSTTTTTVPETTTSTTTTTTTTTSTSTTTSTTVPETTTTLTLSEWRSEHGSFVQIAANSASKLAMDIESGSRVAVETSCSALRDNYRTFLQPVPDPPDPELAMALDQAKDAIFNAARDCHDGVLGSPDYASAHTEATAGAALLNEIIDKVLQS